MSKLLMVDLDNTVRSPLSGAKFISHPRDQRIIPGADRALAHYHKQGWSIVGITNQGGVAAQHKSLEDAIQEQEYTLQLFPEIDLIYFCPDFEGQYCWMVPRNFPAQPIHLDWAASFVGTFRKPGAGMLEAAIMMTPTFKSECWMVGDRAEDEGAAAAAGVNYLDAAIWRSRFLPGLYKVPALTKEQVEFLEGIEL